MPLMPLRTVRWLWALAALLASACATKPPPPTTPVAAATAAPLTQTSPLREQGAESLEPLLQELQAAETAALTSPDDQSRWIHLAKLLLQAHRTQEAARAAWRAVEIEPNFYSWTILGDVLTQGDVLMSMGAAVGAFQAYSMAAQLASDPEMAARNFLNLAYRDFLVGHDQQVLELIEEAEKLAPSLPLVFFHRACVLAVGGQKQAARAQAQKALDLLAVIAPGQTPADPSLAQMQPLAEAIVRGETVQRPALTAAGEMLPERFWAKPPTRGSALSLTVDAASLRYVPLVGGVVMRVRVPTQWSHAQKLTENAIHLRFAPSGTEEDAYAEITLFPTLKEKFDLKQAAEAGRQAATQANIVVGALMPVERKDGLAFWFDSHDLKARANQEQASHYPRMWQGFVFTPPFVISATWLGMRSDQQTQDALVAMVKSIEVFRLETPEAADYNGQ